jgi:hypothetical protein
MRPKAILGLVAHVMRSKEFSPPPTVVFAVLLVATTVVALAVVTPTEARVTRLIIDRIESPTFGGVSFGSGGQYEKLVGQIFGEMEPRDPLNAVIVDIELAPRKARGNVEYVADFYILKPVDLARGNGRLLWEVNNRGNKLALSWFGDAPGTNDPTTAADAGKSIPS